MPTFDVARYLSIDSTGSPTFAPNGDLVYLADTTGTDQVWSVSGPAAWPRRLTPHDERVSTVAASPTRNEVVFGMDRGGNERDQLYRHDLRDGTEHALTDDPEAIHSWGAWAPDGDRVAFAANRTATDRFDVYVQDRTGGAPERVYEGPGGFLAVETWGPDDRLVVSTAHSSNDQDLWFVDPDTGDDERITDDVAANYRHPGFGPDGRLYCVTNRGTDTAYVGRLDPDGHPVMVARGGDWDVDGLAVDRGTGRAVFHRNVDGYATVHAGRLAGDRIERLPDPDLPAGVVYDLAMGPDAERYAVTLSRSDQPDSVYVVDAETGDAERWTAPGTLGIPRGTFRRPETVRYRTFDGRSIPAYWTLPAADAPGEPPYPAIVDIHGGPTHQRQPWFYPVKQYFLNRGYAVLEPNVRGSTGYGKRYTRLDDRERRMDSVADIKAAVEWLHGRDAVDPGRIVAYGRSYGGFMVLAAITEYPDLWAAAVDFVGIANFETFLENTGAWRRSHREAEYGSLENRELLERISPIHKVDRIECPLFIQHGANDPRVPVGEAERIADALEERGVPVETLVFEDEGHHTTSRANRIEEFERIAAFLAEHV